MTIVIIWLVLLFLAEALKQASNAPRRRTAKARYIPSATPVMSPAEIIRIERGREKAEREAEKERKAQATREQALRDIPFFSARIEALMEMETDAARRYYDASEAVKTDAEHNKYSYVIPEKIVQKHITERDRAQRELLKLQGQIRGAQEKLIKAQYIAQAGA